MVKSIQLSAAQLLTLNKIPANSTQSGSVARYAKVSDNEGVKLYRTKKLRDMCYDRHIIAHAGNVGPNVWHPFFIKLWGIQWWGFYMEHAKLAKEFKDWNEAYRNRSVLELKMKTVFKDTRGYFDLSDENFGQLADGRWVAIDVSHIEDDCGAISVIRPHWRDSHRMERNKRV